MSIEQVMASVSLNTLVEFIMVACVLPAVVGMIPAIIYRNVKMVFDGKKELIEGFIDTINTKTNVQSDWENFVKEQKEIDLAALIEGDKLKPDETQSWSEILSAMAN